MVLLASVNFSYSQTVSLRGRVTDNKNNPMGGVSILVKDTKTGTTTKDDGTFTLNVSSTGGKIILVATHTGFASAEKEVNGNAADIRFTLVQAAGNLEDVIVISPLGLTRKAKSVTYSSQSVDPDRLTEARDLNLVNGLAGKVAGIQVTGTGQPGSSSRVILRGDNSITGNSQPLYVVDGVPISDNNGNPANGGLNNNLDVGQGAADLNPDDIESIEILKGPNAAALYGSQAANGAILITTRKAKVGDKSLGIALNQNIMFNTITEFPSVQNEWGEGSNGKVVNGNTNIVPGTGAISMGLSTQSWGAPMLGQPYNTYSGQPHGYYPQPDNVTSLYKTSLTNNSNISISKADAVSAFRASYTFTGSNDVMQKQNVGIRHNFNLTASRKLGNLVTIDTRLLYTYQDWKNRTTRNPAQDNSSPMAYYLYVPRSIDPDALIPYKDANGNEIRYGNQSDGFDNIFWNINENKNEDKRNRFIGGLTATINLLSSLKLRVQASGDFLFYSQYQYKEPGGRITQTGFYSNDSRTDQNTNYEALLIYNTKFGKDFTLSASAGANTFINTSVDRNAFINSLLVHNMPSIANTNSTQTVNESNVRSKTQSLYGTATVGFRDFLFLDATGRNDWSSTLPPQNNSYFYSSLGTSFLFSRFITSNKLISYGKIRASWAKVGNAAGPYQLTNTYSYSGLFLGNPNLTYTNVLKNANLKPEQVVSKEVGLDLGLFKNSRLRISATAYQTSSTNQILTAGTPYETGFNSRVVNAGEMRNRGIEVSVNATALQTKKFTWTVLANWSTNKNEVLSMVPGVSKLQFGQTLGIFNNAIVGQPFGILTGSIPYRSGDTVLMNISKNGRILQDNLPPPIVGSPRPDWIGSVGSSFKYGGFDLSFLVTIKMGGVMYSGTMARMNFYGNSLASLIGRDDYYFSSFILGENSNEMINIGQQVGTTVTRYWDSARVKGKRWYDNAYYPKVDATGKQVVDKNGRFVPGEKAVGWFNPQNIAGDNVTGNVELALYDATSVKLSEFIFGYTVPPTFLRKTAVKSVRVAFVGRNLWQIFKNTPRGIDPESALNSGTTGVGVEAGGSFPYAQYGFDLKVSF